MTQNKEELKKRYSLLPDEDLLRIAMKDSADLTPEAFHVMTKELERRKLKDSVASAIDAQLRCLSSEELSCYCEIIQKQPCPNCGKNQLKLNAILVSHVISLVFITFSETKLSIACPACLQESNKDANLKTWLFGLWGIGIFDTIKSLSLNYKMAKYIGSETPTPVLENFVQDNIGKIEAYKDKSEDLQFLIKHAKASRLTV
jgi:hypothetical protein